MLRPLAKLLLRLGGWTAVGGRPGIPKAVIIAAPHTSNWDGVWAIVYKFAIGIDIHFFAKHTLFRLPFRRILSSFGARALDRSRPGSAVAEVVGEFAHSDSYYFGLAPEGTRSLKPGWKSGFYRLATEARVPLILGFLDYGERRLGLGPVMTLTGDRNADLAEIRAFYANVTGRWPEKTSPVEFPAKGSSGYCLSASRSGGFRARLGP